jgi:hypothetical protein
VNSKTDVRSEELRGWFGHERCRGKGQPASAKMLLYNGESTDCRGATRRWSIEEHPNEAGCMRDLKRWSRLVSVVGAVSLVTGSFDPMEGSALILPGTGLLALASYLGHEDRRVIAYRTWSFVLVALGVAALFALSASGGVGGSSARSTWWALLILPYLVGWSIDIWGPGSPRWVSMAGIVIGVWYLTILAMMVRRPANVAHSPSIVPAIIIALIGMGTVAACTVRLRKEPPPAA